MMAQAALRRRKKVRCSDLRRSREGEKVRLDARPLAIVDAMRVRLPVAMDARDQA